MAEPKDRDALFLGIARERGLLDEAGERLCRETQDALTKVGYSRSMARIAGEKGILTEEQVRGVRAEMARRGVLPRIGNYELLAKLGQGGMGTVYKARQLSLDRVVALKVLSRELAADTMYVERFRREGLIAARIAHPNAVQVHDVGEDRGQPFIVMEYVDGVSADRLLASGPLDERRALAIVRGIAAALAVAHERGIVHRDIKPSNILLTKTGQPKLADLGIARQTGVESGTLTKTGAAIGTAHYMSPEQCRGVRDIDGRSDIYSLGATLFHFVCGRPPYDGDTGTAIMVKHVTDPLPDPKAVNPGMSDAAADLIRRMMAKDVAKRVSSCAEVIAKIDVLSAPGAAVTAPRAPETARPVQASSDTAPPAQAPLPAVSMADSLRSQVGDLFMHAGEAVTGRQVLARTRAVDKRLAAVRQFAATWNHLAALIDGARRAASPAPAEAQTAPWAECRRYVASQYQGVLSLLEKPDHGGGIISMCTSDVSLATIHGMSQDEYAALSVQWQAGARLLAEFDQFLQQVRREILRQHFLRYFWARYFGTAGRKMTLLLAAVALLSAVVGYGVIWFAATRKIAARSAAAPADRAAARGREAPAPLAPPAQDGTPPASSVTISTRWPFDAAEANRRQQAAAAAIKLPAGWTEQTRRVTAATPRGDQSVEVTFHKNSIGIEFVVVPAGEFVMGSAEDAPPAHKVTLTKPFLLGATEVTQAQWEAVMGSNPSHFKGANNPVESVSWDDCQEFLKKLCAQEGVAAGTYRLPTEAEWEYACRAGTATRFYSGDGDSALDAVGWYIGNSGSMSHPVGGKQPNGGGLYDMHGNVYEWCQGWYGAYDGSAASDPSGPRSGSLRVVRGGGWGNAARYCRSASRSRCEPGYRHSNMGFRLVRIIQ